MLKVSKLKVSFLLPTIIIIFITFWSIKSYRENHLKIYEDYILSLLSIHISDSIEDYYGYAKLYDSAKILKLIRLPEGEFCFKAVVQVRTFTGAHNPPYGLETIVIQNNLWSGINVIEFYHEDL